MSALNDDLFRLLRIDRPGTNPFVFVELRAWLRPEEVEGATSVCLTSETASVVETVEDIDELIGQLQRLKARVARAYALPTSTTPQRL